MTDKHRQAIEHMLLVCYYELHGINEQETDIEDILQASLIDLMSGEAHEPKQLYKVVIRTLNIRSGPGTYHPDIGNLHRDEVLEALETHYSTTQTWIRFDIDKWACVRSGQEVYMVTIQVSS